MRTEARRACNSNEAQGPVGGGDWQWLLHPAGAYSRPSDVVRDDDLTVSEKRAILASWASDASAVHSVPSMRKPPLAERPIPIDEIMEALRSLDAEVGDGLPPRKVSPGGSSPWCWPPAVNRTQHRRQ
jgi:hypothetical protein